MSKKANPTLVGAFVLLGLLLGVAGVLLFGSVKLFTQPHLFVLYFEGSVKGLNPGAAVMVSGVKIGTVTDVLIRLNQRDDDNAMPVLIEVDEAILRRKSDRVFDLSDEAALQSSIDRGLRARLEAESLVTGVLYVELGFHPEAGPPVFHQVEPLHRELPTQPSTVQALLDNLARLDMAGLSERMDSVLARLDEGLGQLNVAQLNQSVTNLLGSVQALISSPGLTNAVTDIDQTVNELRELSATLRTRLPALTDNAEGALEELKRTAADVQQTSEQLRGVLAPNSPLAHGLLQSVKDLGEASRALKELAEYLQRNPNAILSGRARPDPAP